MFNLAIDSKLRGCDVVALKVEDVAPSGYAVDRATVRQKKTGQPVRFELTEQTRQAVDDYVRAAAKKPGEFMFTSRLGSERSITTRQYARLVSEWIACIGLDPHLFGTHSLRTAVLVICEPCSSCSVTPRSKALSGTSVLMPSP
jgi:integrase